MSTNKFMTLALPLAVVLAAAAAPARALDLTIEFSGARSVRGTVSAALYADAAQWLKLPVAAERVAAAGERVVIVFRNLAPGSYAIAAFHDENGNGKMDANVVGIPTEAFGFSREARGAFGPPKWDAATFELRTDLTLKVVLQ